MCYTVSNGDQDPPSHVWNFSPPTPNSLHFDTQLDYYLHPLPDGAWLDVVVIVAVVEVKIMVVILLIVIVLVVLMVSVGCFSDRGKLKDQQAGKDVHNQLIEPL